MFNCLKIGAVKEKCELSEEFKRIVVIDVGEDK